MSVRYIRVTPLVDLFLPATRSFGDIAIIGATDAAALGPRKFPVSISNPNAVSTSAVTLAASAATPAADTTLHFAAVPASIVAGMGIVDLKAGSAIAPNATVVSTTTNTVVMSQPAAGAGVSIGDAIQFINPNNGKPVNDGAWFKGPLGDSVKTAFAQAPGPTTVWAIATNPGDGADAVDKALLEAAKIDVQIVVLANTPLTGSGQDKKDIEALAAHCSSVSSTGGDGKERIGVAMLGSGVTDVTLVSATMAQSRMTMIAHKSTDDAAAALAGVIAGYPPPISLLLKPITLDMGSTFTDDEITQFDKARVNWVTRTPLLPGQGFYVGEGYTLGVDQPYIDIVRTIDDISFALKAALIRSIGVLRISRAGLRALVSRMSAVLQPLEDNGVINSYLLFVPLLALLDKDPAKLSDIELQLIHNAQATRTVDSIVTIEYAAAIHRLNITLRFE